MKYVYPAIFTPEDGNTLASVPDLKGCHTFGASLPEAIELAKDAAEGWLSQAERDGWAIPTPTAIDAVDLSDEAPGAFVSLIAADTEEYRRQNDSRAVKKTLSIPAWLNYQAEQANAPFSQILQQGLKEYLHVA
jgi:predicted RNase H-like HicB family nuclease